MNSNEYLEKSARTAAPTKPEDMKLSLSDFLALTDVIESGISSDQQKRVVFYKTSLESAEARADSAYTKLHNIIKEADIDNKVLKVDQQYMDIYHAILGIQSEVGELAEQFLYSLLEGKELDLVNLKEETGDSAWYSAMLLRAIGFSFEEAFEKNIAKLQKRYPEKFTSDNAVNRNLSEERKTLE